MTDEFQSKTETDSKDAASPQQRDSREFMASFSLLYESKDGRFCLFEDADGHLTAVRSERLA